MAKKSAQPKFPAKAESDRIENVLAPVFFVRLAKFALVGGGIYVVYLFGSALSGVVFPVVASFVIAYILDPVVDWFEARRIPRPAGILIVLVLLLVGGGLFAAVLYPTIKKEASSVVVKLPVAFDSLQNRGIPYVEETIGITFPPTIAEAFKEYGSNLSKVFPEILNKGSSIVVGALTQTGAIISSILNVVLIPVFTFYFLRDFDIMKARAREYIPLRLREPVLERLSDMDAVVGRWIRGQLEVCAVLAAFYAVGLGTIFYVTGLGLMNGVAVGILTGFLSMIPYLGPATGFTLSLLIVLIEWSSGWALILVVGLFVLVQVVDGNFITPRIVGEKVGLGPVAVVIVLLAGGSLFGFIGVLFAIPVAAALRVLAPDVVRWYKNSRFFLG